MNYQPSFLESDKVGKTIELFIFLFLTEKKIKRPNFLMFLPLDFFLFFYFFVCRPMAIYIFSFFLLLINKV